MSTVSLGQEGAYGAPGAGRLPLATILVRVAVGLITVVSLASPVWVLLHGMGYLNQAPPPYWNMHAGQPAPGQKITRSVSFGGC